MCIYAGLLYILKLLPIFVCNICHICDNFWNYSNKHISEGADEEDSNATVISDKKCKCGSSQHKRTSHKDCPMNKSKK